MNRAEKRRLERALGHMTTKMKRQRPPSKEVTRAIREQVQERARIQDLILSRNTDPRTLQVPKPPERKELILP
jgi:hypothetical protein